MKIIKLKGIFPSEFKEKPDYTKVFRKYSFEPGRMLSGSKTMYHKQYPDNTVVFNSNIITKKSGKIWYGDVDITMEFDNLKSIADELKEDLYILYESDARFEHENAGFNFWKSRAVAVIKTK